MITVIGGIKGGSGKTTIATNLAVLRASETYKVLLVDADEQRSATDWADQRHSQKNDVAEHLTTIQLSGKSIYSQLEKLKPDYDNIFVDVGGRDTTSQRSALTIADIFLVPFKPRSLDIWTIGAVKQLIEEIKSVNRDLRCYAILNQADPKGTDNEDALQILSECPNITCLPCQIGQRKAFSNAAADGLGVTEIKHFDKKAASEMETLYKHILGKN